MANANAQNNSNIIIKGNQRVEKETIISYMTFTLNDRVSSNEINNSLKSLYATGLFRDVQIQRDGNNIIIKVVENPIINRVFFEGNKRLKSDDLKTEVQLSSGSTYTKSKVSIDVQRIIQLYRFSGRFGAVVDPKIIYLKDNRVNLIFEIQEGPITKIEKIDFIGNSIFSDQRLKREIASKSKSILRPLTSADRYDPDRLSLDKELLRKLYNENGYIDFRVNSATGELSLDNSSFYVLFSIFEGKKYSIRNINFRSSIESLDLNNLKEVIVIKKGSFYNSSLLEKSVNKISDELGNQGYAFVNVQSVLDLDRNSNFVDITLTISESSKVYVERVNIRGNERTLDKVIRREFTFSEGDPYNSQKISESVKNIRNLGIFEKVDLETNRGTKNDKTILDLKIQEKSTGELSLGMGISSSDGPLGDFSVKERNFLGKGQKLSTSLRLSSRTQEIDLSFTDPYFLDNNYSAGFDLFRKSADLQDTSSFNSKTVGFSLRVGYPLNDKLNSKLSYTLRKDTIADFSSDISSFIRTEKGSNLESSIGYELSYNDLNSFMFPTEGYLFRFSQTFAGLGGDKTFIKNTMDYSYYKEMWENIVTNIVFNQGYIHGLGDDISIVDRFFVGGSNLRGFKTGGIGPRDVVTDDSLGGNMYYSGTAQVKFPLSRDADLPVKGLFFTQIGSLTMIDVSGNNLSDIGNPRISVGIGTSWQTPVGPLRIDYTEAVKKQSFDKTQKIYFSFGTRF
ncbi:MAG: Outer membrane protein assembly factor BamA [Alphaproteobacteria bacterium MarineAlpha2_Bin1]|nr:MAG: Outer membrane protein assembly factor BamA [Alphaproteobacteria bacterium MarineAlpha2_Bin1]